jgi:hypothetical protein
MRHVKIVERAGETYSYAAVDLQTGDVLLRLSDPGALADLCHRLEWAVHQGTKPALSNAALRQRTDEHRRANRPGKARPRLAG